LVGEFVISFKEPAVPELRHTHQDVFPRGLVEVVCDAIGGLTQPLLQRSDGKVGAELGRRVAGSGVPRVRPED